MNIQSSLLAAVLFFLVGCGARSELDASSGAGGASSATTTTGMQLTCPPIGTCVASPSVACETCVDAHLPACTQVTSCDAGQGGCDSDPIDNLACRVWSLETVGCMVDCTYDTCRDAYRASRGPVFPFGLVFNDYDCALCQGCRAECSETPNFQLLCGTH